MRQNANILLSDILLPHNSKSYWGARIVKNFVLKAKIAKPTSSQRPPTIFADISKLEKIHKLTENPIKGDNK